MFNSIIDGTITSVESNATSVGDYVFYHYSSLTSVSLPNATSIGDYAFNNCSSLTSASFPSATSIGDYAFRMCSNCQLFDFRGVTQVPTLANNNAFSYTPSTKKIVVPDSLYDKWITSTNWSSSENNIVTSIIKASDYEATL